MREFYKYHGLGNDFIIFNNLKGEITLSEKEIIALCERHKGIGADGIILVENSKEGDFFMNYYDSDGSSKFCGNGLRCTAKFIKDNNLAEGKNVLHIATNYGIKDIILEADDTLSVNMSKPMFEHSDFPPEPLEIENLIWNCVSVGNPHAITFVDNLDNYDLLKIGPIVENNKNFPNKINVEIVEQKSSNDFKVKVWERGGFPTLACGSGATAVYAMARKYKGGDEKLTVELPGGKLFFSENEHGDIIMRGPAVLVYKGVLYE